MSEKTVKILRWVVRFLEMLSATAVGVANLTSVMGPTATKVVSVVGAAALILSGQVRGWLPGRVEVKKVAAGVGLVLLVLLVALSQASCNKYAAISAAYRTTIMVERGLREADPHVGAWVRRGAASCKKKHGAKTAAYKACFKPTADKGKAFIAVGKGNRVTQDAIRAAHLGITKADVLRLAAATGCAALEALELIGNFVPKVAQAATKLKSVKGVICAVSR